MDSESPSRPRSEGNTSSEEQEGSRDSHSLAQSIDIDVNPPRNDNIDDIIRNGNQLGEELLSKVLQVSQQMIHQESPKDEVSISRSNFDKEEIIADIPQEIPVIQNEVHVVESAAILNEHAVSSKTSLKNSNVKEIDESGMVSPQSPDNTKSVPKSVSPNPTKRKSLAEPNVVSPKIDEKFDIYGFIIKGEYEGYNKISSDTNLESQWKAIINNWNPKRKGKKIKKLCRLGIPNSVRPEVWKKLVGFENDFKPLLYTELTTRETNETYEVIDRDISRCYPEHQKFRNDQGKSQLQYVLRAFTHMHPDIGYCQGMGRLAGLLLMRMEPEESFWTFNAIIQKYIPKLYLPSLVQMRVDALVFERLIFRKIPKLYKHLKTNELHALTFTTQWFMTMYTMALPWPSVLRVWDVILSEGEKAIFKFGLAILECCKSNLILFSKVTFLR
eukprot:NODE_68_length_25399_cov_0.885771.p4 type:complete len:443 gc:universal NODE_68_length_25399_cov_0.885771:18485-17157(-)